MAQAARLNLRMQKELKLLLTDPPPGASFPFLDSYSDLSSLSTIHAQIDGPEGTVYAKGVFEVKVQIPERYPFQPPSVTFVTPIYHPNIDNGGRICLDILNLPPKGAWQPSLNISTVLTSIGLLLSEPNPDDGLMREASQEYKYNRQAFDQKARSMTQKYATAGAGANSSSTQGVQNLTPGMTKFSGSEEWGLEEFVSSPKEPCGISRKLSLDCSSSIQVRDCDAEVSEVEAKGKRKEANVTLDECNLRQEELCGTRRKLSLGSSCQIQKRNGLEKENIVANQSSLQRPQTSPTASPRSFLPQHNICSQQTHPHHQTSESTNESIRMPCDFNQEKLSLDTFLANDVNNKKMLVGSQISPFQTHSNASSSMPLLVNSSELQPHEDFINRMGNDSSHTLCQRISSVGKKLSLRLEGSFGGQERDNKENVVPIHKLLVSRPKRSSGKSGIRQKLSGGPLTQLLGNNDNNIQFLSQKLSMDTYMFLPLEQPHGCNEKQCSLDDDAKVTGETEQQKIDESPMPEEVIVLDSEDSEEESDGALRSKLLLTGKRRVDRRAKA